MWRPIVPFHSFCNAIMSIRMDRRSDPESSKRPDFIRHAGLRDGDGPARDRGVQAGRFSQSRITLPLRPDSMASNPASYCATG